MVGDAKRAVVWMRTHARDYGVSPRRIVVSGGSAGGHLALMAAYTAGKPDPRLTPEDVADKDTSVLGVVSCYGPTDLLEMYKFEYAMQAKASGKPASREGDSDASNLLAEMFKKLIFGNAPLKPYTVPELFTNILGATPVDEPGVAAAASPITHARPGLPPTLLLHGEHDTFVPVTNARRLHARLEEQGVPNVYVEFPHTEHGFDLLFARFSPSMQSALYNTERFLALLLAQPISETKEPEYATIYSTGKRYGASTKQREERAELEPAEAR
jgi:acetyl esterase/lipase